MRSLFTFLFILICSTSALAQKEDAEEATQPPEETSGYYILVEEELDDIPQSSTAIRFPLKLEETPASVSVVPDWLFTDQNALFLSEALENVAGVNVQSGFSNFDFFTVRGFDSLTSSLVLVDGVPEPEVTFYKLYNVERVEVLKGPGAFLYGGNPLSGTVNLVRKRPMFTNFLRINNSYGSFDTYNGKVDFNLSRPDSPVAFRVNGAWLKSDFYRDSKDNHDLAIFPSVTWKINNESFLNVNFEAIKEEYEPDSGIPLLGNSIPDVPRTRSYQSPFDESDQNLIRAQIEYETKIGSSVTLRNKFYNTNLDWKTKGTLLNGAFPDPFGGVQVIRTLTDLDDQQNFLGNQLELLTTFDTGGISHQMLTGFEVTRKTDDFLLRVALLPTIDLTNPVERATEPLFFIPNLTLRGDTSSLVFAPYVADHIRFSDQWQALVGARLDSFDFENDATATSRDDTKFSPMFGLTFSPNTENSIYFQTGRAFAPPSSLVVGEREPEESTQFEGGVKSQFLNGKVRTAFAVYHIDKENIAIPDANGITRQTGDQRSLGIEAEVSATPGDGVTGFLAYAFNDSELTQFTELFFTGTDFILLDHSGNTPAFAPHHILNAWAGKKYTNGFGFGGGPRYVSSQFISENNAFEIDGYVTADAMAFYEMESWRFQLNFKNIFDREYETRGFGASSVIPADPFAVYLSVDFRL